MNKRVSDNAPVSFVKNRSNDAHTMNLRNGKIPTGGVLMYCDVGDGESVKSTIGKCILKPAIAQR